MEKNQRTKQSNANFENALKKLNEDLLSFTKDENTYKSALVDLGKFDKYTLNNKLLLLNQMKERNMSHLSPVFKTYNDWNKENINVKKGAKAFEIIIPNKVQRYKDDDNIWKVVTSSNRNDIIQSGKEIKQFTFFNVKNVAFHISSTNSVQNIISPGENNRLTLDLDKENNFDLIYESVKDLFSKKYNISEDLNMNPDMGGRAIKSIITDEYQIELNGLSTSSMKLKTLFHEAAHIELEHLDSRNYLSRDIKEVEAESTAFLFAKQFGIDTSISMNYISGWSNGENISEVFDNVLNAASKINDEFLNDIIEDINERDINHDQIADINQEDIFAPTTNMELF